MSAVKKSRRKRFINILGVRVRIKYESREMYDGDDLLHGCYCSDTNTIHISTKSDINATLLHECAHAVLHLSGISHMISMKLEESIVSAMEQGLKDYFSFK